MNYDVTYVYFKNVIMSGSGLEVFNEIFLILLKLYCVSRLISKKKKGIKKKIKVVYGIVMWVVEI